MTNNDLAEKLIDKLRDAGALLSDDDLAARRAVSALMRRLGTGSLLYVRQAGRQTGRKERKKKVLSTVVYR